MKHKLLRGDETISPAPDAYLSKIEFIAMISRAYGLYDEDGQPPYLTEDDHFAAAVGLGLLETEQFPMEDWAKPFGRFEAADLCYRTLLALGGYVENGSEVYMDNTADKHSIPMQYRKAINGVYAAGVMNGGDDALSFRGWDCVTKAQGCVILHRMLDEQARRLPALPAEFDKLFGSYTTGYGEENGAGVVAQQESRIFNISKAGAVLSGTVIAPGEKFSFNGTIGNPNKANGYQQVMVMSGNKMVPSYYGSGICQISTTLFAAALKADMTIAERKNHGIKSNYVPAGTDSTVYYPGIDLKLVNPYPCPVRIIFDVDPMNFTITVKLYGSTAVYVPEVTWDITQKGRIYKLTRYADGVANYSCTSKYKN